MRAGSGQNRDINHPPGKAISPTRPPSDFLTPPGTGTSGHGARGSSREKGSPQRWSPSVVGRSSESNPNRTSVIAFPPAALRTEARAEFRGPLSDLGGTRSDVRGALPNVDSLSSTLPRRQSSQQRLDRSRSASVDSKLLFETSPLPVGGGTHYSLPRTRHSSPAMGSGQPSRYSDLAIPRQPPRTRSPVKPVNLNQTPHKDLRKESKGALRLVDYCKRFESLRAATDRMLCTPDKTCQQYASAMLGAMEAALRQLEACQVEQSVATMPAPMQMLGIRNNSRTSQERRRNNSRTGREPPRNSNRTGDHCRNNGEHRRGVSISGSSDRDRPPSRRGTLGKTRESERDTLTRDTSQDWTDRGEREEREGRQSAGIESDSDSNGSGQAKGLGGMRLGDVLSRLNRCGFGARKRDALKDMLFGADRQKLLLVTSLLRSQERVRKMFEEIHLTFPETRDVDRTLMPCTLVTAFKDYSGYLCLCGSYIDFVGYNRNEDGLEEEQKFRHRSSDIVEIYSRRYRSRPCGMEIFMKDTTSHLLHFMQSECPDPAIAFYAKRLQNAMEAVSNAARVRPMIPNTRDAKNLIASIQRRWQRHQLSNFQYLMELNKFAGRSFHDLSQYPVLPWVLQDLGNRSETLQLGNAACFRDLSRPVGTFSGKAIEGCKRKYEETKERYMIEEECHVPPVAPYHHAAHYSSPAIVLYYLTRMPPFTREVLRFQGGRFDRADRMFHSVEVAWEMAAKTGGGERELIPDFFNHESVDFLRNGQGLNLPTRQDGNSIGNVALPKWAHGSPESFLAHHSMAMESDYVSHNLHQWIDLIFGFKQQGASGRRAYNLYHPYSYIQDVDTYVPKVLSRMPKHHFDDHIDIVMKEWTRMVCSFQEHFGQCPRVLFSKAHPKKHPPPKTILSQGGGSRRGSAQALRDLFGSGKDLAGRKKGPSDRDQRILEPPAQELHIWTTS